MTEWGAILEKPQAEFPELNFVRFVARKFYSAPCRLDVLFLDLGCGGGANSEFLEDKGFTVISLDSAPNSRANIIADLTTWDYPKGKFDCVLDNNTLCHLENPPMMKIRNTLKRGGTFFSVAPSHLTARAHLEGKGFCRCATRFEIEQLYSPFSKIRLDTASYPNNGQQIVSWIIECTK